MPRRAALIDRRRTTRPDKSGAERRQEVPDGLGAQRYRVDPFPRCGGLFRGRFPLWYPSTPKQARKPPILCPVVQVEGRDVLGKDAWMVKLILGGLGFVIAGWELTFGGQTSQGVLLLVGALLVAEGWSEHKRRGGRD